MNEFTRELSLAQAMMIMILNSTASMQACPHIFASLATKKASNISLINISTYDTNKGVRERAASSLSHNTTSSFFDSCSYSKVSHLFTSCLAAAAAADLSLRGEGGSLVDSCEQSGE